VRDVTLFVSCQNGEASSPSFDDHGQTGSTVSTGPI